MTQQPRGSGPDPVGDFQRWLVRSGAREISGHIASTLGLGGQSGKRGDVWEHATAPPPHEPPECAWCPWCRAARTLRDSGPGLASHAAAAGETLAGLVQDAMSAVESVLASQSRRPGAGEPGATAPGGAHDEPAPANTAAANGAAARETTAAEDTAGVWETATSTPPAPGGEAGPASESGGEAGPASESGGEAGPASQQPE
ncbi:MAG TPA: hypothetical protein VE343_12385 [Streptosporangiaceae bacterium]|nr:hypothetical protein [Streptosporangiaceae bacterium]